MTNCVESPKGATKAVASGLAAVLAVGMIPAAAFADDAAEDIQEEAAIELEVADAAASFAAGEATAATDKDGSAIADVSKITFVAKKATAQYPIITKVKDSGGNSFDIDSTYTQTIYTADLATDPSGKTPTSTVVAANAVINPGSYVVTVAKGANSLNVPFTITAANLDDAVLGIADTEDPDKIGTAAADFTVDYVTGKSTSVATALVINVWDGETKLEAGADKDYTIRIFNDKDVEVTALHAGTYKASLIGKGVYEGATKNIDFTIKPFELTDKNVSVVFGTNSGEFNKGNNTELAATDIKISVDKTAVPMAGTTGLVDVKLVSKPSGAVAYDKDIKGVYKYEVTPHVDATTPAQSNTDMTGKATITIENYASDADIYYDGVAWTTKFAAGTMDVNHTAASAADRKDFDISLVEAKSGTTDVPFTVEVKDAKGNAATTADLTKPGVWSIKVKAESADGTIGKEETLTLTVIEGEIDTANIEVAYKDKVDDNGAKDYDGEDATKDIKVTVKDASGKTLSEGSDYKVLFVESTASGYDPKKDTETSFVNVAASGKVYRVVVASEKYELSGATPVQGVYYDDQYTFTVRQLALKGNAPAEKGSIAAYNLRVKDLKADEDGTLYFDYTGSAITPVYEFLTVEDDTNTKDVNEETWAALPTDQFKVSSIKLDDKDVKEVKDKGTYVVVLAKADKIKTDNFGFTPANVTLTFKVADKHSFVDEPATSWSYEYVEGINENGWMTGYSDGKHFGPKDNMKRGDVCLVLYRMATGTDGKNVPNAPENTFTDVKEGSYWEDAIAWAADAGIVTGYSGKDAGKFGPSDNVTREQFMLMMARYAKYQNVDTKSDGKAMATKKDPQKVSSWAKDAVAWGVDGDMIGSNGTIDPQGKVTREQIAKIVMVFADANKGVATPVAKDATYKVTTNAADVKGNAATKGVVVSSAEKAAAGEKVTITATPSQTGETATIKVVAADGSLSTGNDVSKAVAGQTETLEFTMPASDVTVTVAFA